MLGAATVSSAAGLTATGTITGYQITGGEGRERHPRSHHISISYLQKRRLVTNLPSKRKRPSSRRFHTKSGSWCCPLVRAFPCCGLSLNKTFKMCSLHGIYIRAKVTFNGSHISQISYSELHTSYCKPPADKHCQLLVYLNSTNEQCPFLNAWELLFDKYNYL